MIHQPYNPWDHGQHQRPSKQISVKFGSGRKAGHGRKRIERCLTLDINQLYRSGCLKPGWSSVCRSTINGGELVDITLHTKEDRLHIEYMGDGLTQHIDITRVPRYLGGFQNYFACPECNRMISKIYASEQGRFLCRHCSRLGYSSQWEDKFGLSVRRFTKIRERLGGDPAAPRPKYRHRVTHESLLLDALDAELSVHRESAKKLESLSRRVENYRRLHHSGSSDPTQTD